MGQEGGRKISDMTDEDYGHGVGAHAVARDPECSVGGAQEGGDDLVSNG
jgi:hypothetical protein